MNSLPTCRADASDRAPRWWLRAHWLYAALQSQELPDHGGLFEEGPLPVALDVIGQLFFPDGQLVVADPYLMGEEPVRIEQPLQAVSYEVVIARATAGPEEERIAAALLVSDADDFVSWEMAHWTGQDVSLLGPQEYFGYGVDAGTGCFASTAAAKVVGQVLATDADMLEDLICRALSSDSGNRHAAVVAPEAGAPPIAVFQSGWGDGRYPTWLGMNNSGQVVVAMTDFLLTGDPYAMP